LHLEVAFTHARQMRLVTVHLGWLQIRLPGRRSPLWVLVAHDPAQERDLVLLTNILIRHKADAQMIYSDWRPPAHRAHLPLRPGGWLADQRHPRLNPGAHAPLIYPGFARGAVRLSPRCHLAPSSRPLASPSRGKVGQHWDLDGPYVLLAGISAVWITAATLTFATQEPFPHQVFSYG
jgi:hypothetical protein